MSRAVSPQGKIRKSGNSHVVTIPADIVHALNLGHGDLVFWSIEDGKLYLDILKFRDIIKKESEVIRQDDVDEGYINDD